MFSEKDFSSLTQKATGLEGKLDKTTERYLLKLQKQETKLKRKLSKVDSIKAQALFADLEEKYASLKNKEQKVNKYAGVYVGHLDSLANSLKFLESKGVANEQLSKSLKQFSSLQTKFNQTETIKKFIQDRKQFLKQNLEQLGMLKELRGFSKEAYYYSAQLKEYKAIWDDPSKLEKKLLEWATKTEAFKDFFRKNSQLASLFTLPNGNAPAPSLQGLQTRASLQQVMAARFGSGPNVQNMVQQNVQAAQSQLNELKNKLSQYGTGSYSNGSDIDIPKDFRPNSQRTKIFTQRLEYGANVQSQKSSSYFPVTSDLGLSLGYKLNDKSSVGIGASYKLGWGRGWNKIRLTNEGLGLRSYLDYQLKGSLYVSGGYEQNYRAAFRSIQQLKDYSAWQTSGLIGISKRYKVSKKVKGDMKLLWDFLSYKQLPRTQAILFRIGYNLK